MTLALNVGLLGIRGREHRLIGPLELRQVPAQPLSAADNAPPTGPDDDEPFAFERLQCGRPVWRLTL